MTWQFVFPLRGRKVALLHRQTNLAHTEVCAAQVEGQKSTSFIAGREVGYPGDIHRLGNLAWTHSCRRSGEWILLRSTHDIAAFFCQAWSWVLLADVLWILIFLVEPRSSSLIKWSVTRFIYGFSIPNSSRRSLRMGACVRGSPRGDLGGMESFERLALSMGECCSRV